MDLDVKLLESLKGFECHLIQVPYSLKTDNKSISDLFVKTYLFPKKIVSSLKKFVIKPFEILNIQRSVDKILCPTSDDILLVHTEMDLLNQYIINLFYKCKASIFLLEDGTATMCYYNMVPQKPSLIERIKAVMLREFYGFRGTTIGVYGSEVVPLMADSKFNGVIVNYGNSIIREIPLFKLKQSFKPIEILRERGAIFFNQPMYLLYSTEKEYILLLKDLLEFSSNFDIFYFKFHPAESLETRSKIRKFINEIYSSIIILDDSEIAEEILDKYPVRYAITINSTSALNLINRGVIPIFLSKFYNERFPDSSFESFSNFLMSIKCRVPSKLSDVRPGFSAFTDLDNSTLEGYALEDILNKHNG